ncbi:hypothetical protein [Sulfurospirillum arcachonense]|uniref:hypothetical protein n=1 Tax=Sulfurospirillum arcachonense TaxID=57666 RepID=UPI000469DDE9|nr:hypothetical protein [Sulfurospirillum arcachonense]
MDKEERKRLQIEFRQLKRSEYDKAYDKVLYFFIIASLAIFIIPTNILSVYPSLKYFTQLMATLFPNISIYAQKSKWSEVTEFYFSYMWIVALIIVVLMIVSIPTANEKAKKYFGTGEYKGKGALDHKYLMFVNIFTLKNFLVFIAIFLMFGYVFYLNYTGSLIDGGISRMRFSEAISTRFGMFFIGNVFQNFALFVIAGAIISSIIQTIHIQKLKKGK